MSIVKKLLIFFIFIFFLSSCSKPNVVQMQKVAQLSAIYKGKLWWKLKIVQDGENRVNGGYASFIAGKEFLIVNLRSPFNFRIATVFWRKEEPSKIRIVDYFHHREIILNFNKKNPQEFTRLPYYFLGLVTSKKTFRLFKNTYATYEFSKEKKQGLVKGKNFYFLWKFKSIKKISSNLKPVLRVPKDFRVIVITF